MSAIAFDTHRAVKALCEAGAAEPLAEAFVETIGDAISGNVATKADITASEGCGWSRDRRILDQSPSEDHQRPGRTEDRHRHGPVRDRRFGGAAVSAVVAHSGRHRRAHRRAVKLLS